MRKIDVREKHRLAASRTCPDRVYTRTGDKTQNLGTCSGQELNPQLFGYRMTLQPIKPHQPGPQDILKSTLFHISISLVSRLY